MSLIPKNSEDEILEEKITTNEADAIKTLRDYSKNFDKEDFDIIEFSGIYLLHSPSTLYQKTEVNEYSQRNLTIAFSQFEPFMISDIESKQWISCYVHSEFFSKILSSHNSSCLDSILVKRRRNKIFEGIKMFNPQLGKHNLPEFNSVTPLQIIYADKIEICGDNLDWDYSFLPN